MDFAQCFSKLIKIGLKAPNTIFNLKKLSYRNI